VGGVLLALGFIKERAQSSPVAKGSDGPKERQVPAESSVSQPQRQPMTTGVRCAACGAENAQGDKFCGSCGAILAPVAPPSKPTCTRCGATVVPSDSFCGECGEPVRSQATPPQPQPTVQQASASPSKSRRVGVVLGTIILLAISALYYAKQQSP